MDRLLELTYLAERSHFWFRGFRWFIRPELARAVNGRSSLSLLDCGCGTGANIDLLREFGNAFGFDLTWNGLELGRRMGRHRFARASIDAIPFPDASMDVATSFDVLQCLPDEIERDAVREMWRVLRPGGHLILHVAALDILRGHHAVLSEELRRYTPSRLRQLVEGSGFLIDRITYDHASLFPVMLPVRMAQRWTRGTGEFDISLPPAPINAVLTALVRLEAAVLRFVDMPIGSSLLCHARKPA